MEDEVVFAVCGELDLSDPAMRRFGGGVRVRLDEDLALVAEVHDAAGQRLVRILYSVLEFLESKNEIYRLCLHKIILFSIFVN